MRLSQPQLHFQIWSHQRYIGRDDKSHIPDHITNTFSYKEGEEGSFGHSSQDPCTCPFSWKVPSKHMLGIGRNSRKTIDHQPVRPSSQEREWKPHLLICSIIHSMQTKRRPITPPDRRGIHHRGNSDHSSHHMNCR